MLESMHPDGGTCALLPWKSSLFQMHPTPSGQARPLPASAGIASHSSGTTNGITNLDRRTTGWYGIATHASGIPSRQAEVPTVSGHHGLPGGGQPVALEL